jgi:hypothetical protein
MSSKHQQGVHCSRHAAAAPAAAWRLAAHRVRPGRRAPIAAGSSSPDVLPSPGASSALSCRISPLDRTLSFPHRGSGLLWARSTGLKLWPGALLLARAAAEADGALLASLHPCLRRAATAAGAATAAAASSSVAAPAGGVRAALGSGAAPPAWRGWQDARVLELGCGLGAVAATATWLGARVVATDGDADLLRVRGRAQGGPAAGLPTHPGVDQAGWVLGWRGIPFTV